MRYLGSILFGFMFTANSAVIASIATFDDLAEGFHGTTLVDGGITFFNADSRIGPLASEIAIDDVSGFFAEVPSWVARFSPPNVLALTAFSPGPFGSGAGRFGEIHMKVGSVQSYASLDVFFHGGQTEGNQIVLDAYLNNVLVGNDAVTIPSFGLQYANLSISDIEFDTLRLSGTGMAHDGVFFGEIDNVVIVPEPCTILLCLAPFAVYCVGNRFNRPKRRRLEGVIIFVAGAFFLEPFSANAQCTGAFDSQNEDNSDLYGCSSPFDRYHNTHVFSSLCCAASGTNVTITVDAHADLSGATRFLDLYLNDVLIREDMFIGSEGLTNCFPQLFYSTQTIVITAAQFNNALILDANRTGTFRLESSCDVRRLCTVCGNCPQSELTLVRLQYTKSSVCPCINDSHCNDSNPCTTDTCSSGSCSHSNLSDGTACGTGDVCCSGTCRDCCNDGQCSGGEHCCSNVCRECCTAEHCDDGNACTGTETCVSNNCSTTFIGDCNDNDREDFCDITEGTSADCNDNGVPDECPNEPGTSALMVRDPDDEKSWSRQQHNTAWLTFKCDITAPSAGQVLIEELLNGGSYGSDLSSSFTFTVENDGGGQPRILKIVDNGASVTHRNMVRHPQHRFLDAGQHVQGEVRRPDG